MRRFLPLLLILAACAGETAVSTTAPVEPPSTVTTATTVVESTTTTEAGGPVDLCRGRSVLWEPEVVHVAECFAVPVSFVVVDDGWRSRGAKDDTVFLSWRDPTDDAFVVSVGLAARRGDGEVELEVESILERDGVAAVGPIEAGSVAGFEALMVDVEGMRLTGDALLDPSVDECFFKNRVVLHFHSEVYVIAGPFPSLGGEFFGVGACQVVRVWMFEAGDFVVTMIGGTADADRHDEAVAKIEELFEGMSFEKVGS